MAGDRNAWSLPQWKAVASRILNSSEPAIQKFLTEIENNNAGAKAALGAATRGYQVSVWRLAARALATRAANVMSNMTLILFIDTRMMDPIYRQKEDRKETGSLHTRSVCNEGMAAVV